MRTAFISVLGIVSVAAIGCGKEVVNLDGQINGKSVNGSAHWGGPYIVFTDSSLGCQEVDWVKTTYGTSSEVELLTDESFAALQIIYTGAEVIEGTAQIPPNDAVFIESSSGIGTITSKFTGPPPNGSVDVEFDGDWLIGELDIDFGEAGSISGNFEIKKCVNLRAPNQ